MLHENIFRPIHKTWLNFEFIACSFDYTLESFFFSLEIGGFFEKIQLDATLVFHLP